MKAALCFLISGDQKLNKEELWKNWIEHNSVIINVYFHYKNIDTIQSTWIKKHCIPKKYIMKTDYMHVVPAYMSLMDFATYDDNDNLWFCFLTESCVPIVNPNSFRHAFFTHYHKSIMRWEPAYWNVYYHTRANLRFFNKKYQLSNAPWFILTKSHAQICLQYPKIRRKDYLTICDGIIANESIFAMILSFANKIDEVINAETTVTDWDRMTSPTSPYLFEEDTSQNIIFIHDYMQKNPHSLFLRKVSHTFPSKSIIKIMYKCDNLTKYEKIKQILFYYYTEYKAKCLYPRYLYFGSKTMKIFYTPLAITNLYLFLFTIYAIFNISIYFHTQYM